MDFGRPVEGYPPAVQVMKWAESLFFGYERHREPLEVYPLCEPGSLLYSGAVAISKGYTRGSILCFGIVQMLMKEDLSTITPDEAAYFTQWLGLFGLSSKKTVANVLRMRFQILGGGGGATKHLNFGLLRGLPLFIGHAAGMADNLLIGPLLPIMWILGATALGNPPNSGYGVCSSFVGFIGDAAGMADNLSDCGAMAKVLVHGNRIRQAFLAPCDPRWLLNVMLIPCTYTSRAVHEHSYRALQLGHQASLRERKTLLATALRFQGRMLTLMDDLWINLHSEFSC